MARFFFFQMYYYFILRGYYYSVSTSLGRLQYNNWFHNYVIIVGLCYLHPEFTVLLYSEVLTPLFESDLFRLENLIGHPRPYRYIPSRARVLTV